MIASYTGAASAVVMTLGGRCLCSRPVLCTVVHLFYARTFAGFGCVYPRREPTLCNVDIRCALGSKRTPGWCVIKSDLWRNLKRRREGFTRVIFMLQKQNKKKGVFCFVFPCLERKSFGPFVLVSVLTKLGYGTFFSYYCLEKNIHRPVFFFCKFSCLKYMWTFSFFFSYEKKPSNVAFNSESLECFFRARFV